LAPLRRDERRRLPRLHRAGPSTSLDKSAVFCCSKCTRVVRVTHTLPCRDGTRQLEPCSKGMVCGTHPLAVSIMLTLATSGLSVLRLRTTARPLRSSTANLSWAGPTTTVRTKVPAKVSRSNDVAPSQRPPRSTTPASPVPTAAGVRWRALTAMPAYARLSSRSGARRQLGQTKERSAGGATPAR
jgi:hypothetical protein